MYFIIEVLPTQDVFIMDMLKGLSSILSVGNLVDSNLTAHTLSKSSLEIFLCVPKKASHDILAS